MDIKSDRAPFESRLNAKGLSLSASALSRREFLARAALGAAAAGSAAAMGCRGLVPVSSASAGEIGHSQNILRPQHIIEEKGFAMNDILAGLYTMNDARSARSSTWDRSGGNMDCIGVPPGEKRVLAEIEGPGCIRHIYFTHITEFHPHQYRQAILRMYWDGEATPSVEVPIGDFFCVSHCSPRPLNSFLVTVTTREPGADHARHYGYNCYFPMPFGKGARIEIEQQADVPWGWGKDLLWYHVDYERWSAPPPANVGRFHAQWRRENPTIVAEDKRQGMNFPPNKHKNIDGAENYVILEAKGQGCLAGLHLQVDNIGGFWYGEGDDMIFIDDDTWPPSIHGTGSEEIFGGPPCPNFPYHTAYAGFHLVDNMDHGRFNAMFRWYAHDPIRFQNRVRWTIEHGHANNYENDYTSVAYWYQIEPHAPFPQLPPPTERLPRFPADFLEALETERKFRGQVKEHKEGMSPEDWVAFDIERKKLADALHRNRFAEAPKMMKELLASLEARMRK